MIVKIFLWYRLQDLKACQLSSLVVLYHIVWYYQLLQPFSQVSVYAQQFWHRKNREVLLRGRLSTVDLLVPTSLDQLLFILKILLTVLQSYLNEEVNRTEPSPSVRIPGQTLALERKRFYDINVCCLCNKNLSKAKVILLGETHLILLRKVRLI